MKPNIFRFLNLEPAMAQQVEAEFETRESLAMAEHIVARRCDNVSQAAFVYKTFDDVGALPVEVVAARLFDFAVYFLQERDQKPVTEMPDSKEQIVKALEGFDIEDITDLARYNGPHFGFNETFNEMVAFGQKYLETTPRYKEWHPIYLN